MIKYDRKGNAVRNVKWGIFKIVILQLMPFVLRSLIVKYLGDEYLGLNSIFTSILSVLNLAELGFGSAFVYMLYEPIAQNDTEKVCSLLSLYRKIYRIIGLVILVGGLAVIPFLNVIVHNECPDGINLYVIYLITLIDTTISYLLFAYQASVLSAYQRMDVQDKIYILINAALYLAQIVIIAITGNYYLYLIAKPVFTMASNILIAYTTHKMFPEYKPRGSIDSSSKKDIYTRVGALFGHKIGTTVIASADNIVISSFLGLTAVAIYGNYYYIMRAIISFMSMLIQSLQGGIGNSIATEDNDHNYTLFKNTNFIIMWIVSFCTCCFLCLYQPFMKIWMGESRLFAMSTVILLVVYYYTWQSRVGIILFKDSAGLWKADALKPYISSVFNLIANIVLVKTIGINGVFISTIICMVGINAPWEVYVLFKNLFKRSIKEYLLNQVEFLVLTILSCILSYYICTRMSFSNIMNVVVRLLICLIIPNAIILLFTHKKDEFKYAKNYLLKYIKASR